MDCFACPHCGATVRRYDLIRGNWRLFRSNIHSCRRCNGESAIDRPFGQLILTVLFGVAVSGGLLKLWPDGSGWVRWFVAFAAACGVGTLLLVTTPVHLRGIYRHVAGNGDKHVGPPWPINEREAKN